MYCALCIVGPFYFSTFTSTFTSTSTLLPPHTFPYRTRPRVTPDSTDSSYMLCIYICICIYIVCLVLPRSGLVCLYIHRTCLVAVALLNLNYTLSISPHHRGLPAHHPSSIFTPLPPPPPPPPLSHYPTIPLPSPPNLVLSTLSTT